MSEITKISLSWGNAFGLAFKFTVCSFLVGAVLYLIALTVATPFLVAIGMAAEGAGG